MSYPSVSRLRILLSETASIVENFLSNKKVLLVLTVFPAIALFSFVNVLPIVWAVLASFHEISIFSPEWTWAGLSNYTTVLQDGDFHMSVWRAVIFAGGSTLLQLTVGIWIALVVNRQFPLVSVIRGIVFLPYLIPTVVFGFMALWMGNSSWGIINQLLLQAGFISDPIAFFASPDWSMVAVIVTNSWKFTIFVTIFVLARLQSIPEGYYEAATVAGATSWQKFRDITLPNLKNVILIVLLLRGIFMFNKFDIVYVLTQGGPGEATTTAPIHLYQVMYGGGSVGNAAAISSVLFVLILAGAIIYLTGFNPTQEVRVE